MIELKPITITQAKQFIAIHHRHHLPPQGALFAIGVCNKNNPDEYIGVATIGRPVARNLQDGYTCEVTRLCTDGSKNACSILYSASARAAKALGYKKIITYILSTESGHSLLASSWTPTNITRGGSWSSPTRLREDKHPLIPKIKFEKSLT